MNVTTKNILEEVYSNYCFTMSYGYEIQPSFFIFKDDIITPIKFCFDIDEDNNSLSKQTAGAFYAASQNNADAMIMVSEQYIINEKPTEEIAIKIMNRSIKKEEHPTAKKHLVLSYIKPNGDSNILFGEIKKDIIGTRYIIKEQWTENLGDII